MEGKIIMEKEVKAGRKKDISIKIEVEEQIYEWKGVKYKQRKAFAEAFGVREPLRLRYAQGYHTIYFSDNGGKIKRHFGIKNNRSVQFIIVEDVYNTLKNLEREIEEFNKAEKDRAQAQIPLKFIVKKMTLRLLDMYYDAKVFYPNKWEDEMTTEEKERYKRLLNAVKKYNHDAWHLDGYIDAGKYKEGIEFTLDDLENLFKDELQKHIDFLRRKEEKKKELERKRREAIKKAKETGKEVYIRIVDGYDGDEVYPGRDYGWVNVWEVATPDGKIIHKDDPTY